MNNILNKSAIWSSCLHLLFLIIIILGLIMTGCSHSSEDTKGEDLQGSNVVEEVEDNESQDTLEATNGAEELSLENSTEPKKSSNSAVLSSTDKPNQTNNNQSTTKEAVKNDQSKSTDQSKNDLTKTTNQINSDQAKTTNQAPAEQAFKADKSSGSADDSKSISQGSTTENSSKKPGDEKESPQVPPATIGLSISFPKEAGLSNISQSVTFKEGQTVLECLIDFGKESGVPVVYSGSKSMGYVEGINGCFEFDYGAESGWIYSVNGSKPQKSSGSYKLQKGDKVIWKYVYSMEEI